MENKIIQENLFKALGLFLEAIRPYVTAKLGENWHIEYYESLTAAQQSNWEQGIKNGTELQNLIDFHNLKGFAIKHKVLLRADFGKKANSLPTWLEEIAEARHKCQHFAEVSQDEVQRAYANMLLIAKHLKMVDLEQELTSLRDQKEQRAKTAKVKREYSGLIPWFLNVQPHLDIRQGNLDESVFAANLAEVASGNGREIYLNPTVFFSKTFFTAGIKTLARRVIQGLNGGKDAADRVISLQTGFGGGKTHALISLYHLARWGQNTPASPLMNELHSFTGKPQFDSANIAVFTNTTNDPTQGRTIEGQHIQTLWGELAWQLGGKELYELIRDNDENRTAPKGLFKRVLEKAKPALILIDELADYCVAASGITVGASTLSDQTISFMQELSEAISLTDHCVLVATLPASVAEVANSPQASQILSSLSNRLTRVGADTKPVADEEIFEVIRRRLFEDLGDEAQIESVVSGYFSLYQNLWTEVPSNAAKSEYKDKLRKSYPFHPELIDMFRIRWASNHDFQRTRGVLRLLASIVADLWKRQGTLVGGNALIHSSDINFENLDALSGQLKKLYGNGYDAVISADVSGTSSNAFKNDKDKSEYGKFALSQGVASTILLGSFGSTGANKGISIEEIKLNVLKPDSFNHNSVNGSLDMLEEKAHYLYYGSAGSGSKRYWFHTKPNINILINQAKNEVKISEINSEILKRIQSKVNNILAFNVLVAPSEDIPEQTKPTLVILSPEYLAKADSINGNTKLHIEQLATKKGQNERIYRNTMLFLLCSEIGITKLQNDVREYLACLKIRDEYQSQLESDQKSDIKSKIQTYTDQVASSLVSAYSLIVKHSAKNGLDKLNIRQFKNSLDIQINSVVQQLLKDEEWLLESVGLGLLRNNNLLPEMDKPIKAKDVYEAFIRYDDKPMITGVSAVQNSLLKYCSTGEYAIATGDGTNFTKIYYQLNVPFFDVTDSVYWLVDKSLYQPEQPITSSGGETGVVKEGENENGRKQEPDSGKTEAKEVKSITISGKVDVANYSQLFTSFIVPLQKNKVEIEIRIKGKSTQSNPLSETSDAYKITKESARQLGLNFDEE